MTIMSGLATGDFNDVVRHDTILQRLVSDHIDAFNLGLTVPFSHDLFHCVLGLSKALGDTTYIYSYFAEIVVEAIESYLYARLVGGANPSLFNYIEEKLTLSAIEPEYETSADAAIIHERVAPYIEIIAKHITREIDALNLQGVNMYFGYFERIAKRSLIHLTIGDITPQASETTPPAQAMAPQI